MDGELEFKFEQLLLNEIAVLDAIGIDDIMDVTDNLFLDKKKLYEGIKDDSVESEILDSNYGTYKWYATSNILCYFIVSKKVVDSLTSNEEEKEDMFLQMYIDLIPESEHFISDAMRLLLGHDDEIFIAMPSSDHLIPDIIQKYLNTAILILYSEEYNIYSGTGDHYHFTAINVFYIDHFEPVPAATRRHTNKYNIKFEFISDEQESKMSSYSGYFFKLKPHHKLIVVPTKTENLITINPPEHNRQKIIVPRDSSPRSIY